MTNWPVKTLGDICEIYQPQTIGMKDLVPDGSYVVYGANGPIGRYSRFNHEHSEVTVTCRGATCGTVNVTPPQVWITGNAMVVRPNEKEMSKSMLRYWLEGLDYSAVITGAAQPQITRTTLAPVEIPVPPLEEQERIVALLDDATARITELTACYEEARTHANNLFTSALRDALESNPDWPVKTLGEVAVLNPSEPALSEDAPFVPMDAVTAGKRQVQYTQPRGQRSGARARAGDILFARITPCLQNGKVALIQDEIDRCGGSTEFIVVRAGPEVLRGFLYQWITAEHIREHVTTLMKGTTGRQRLDAQDLALTELPVPSLEEQKRIVARLDQMRAKTAEMVAAYDAKLQAAKNLRQSILEAAFAGEL